MSAREGEATGGADARAVEVPLDLWARVVKAIQSGARLSDLTRRAPLGFDLTPFANGCDQILGELLRLTDETAGLEPAIHLEVPDAE